MKYRQQLEDALNKLTWLKWFCYSDSCYVISCNKKLDTVALALANLIEDGTFNFGSISVAWVCGRSVIYLTEAKHLQEIEATRLVCSEFTEEEAPYSISACSRRMMKKVGIEDSCWGDSDKMLESTGWHALTAKPGVYQDKTMYDLKGAYWQLVNRAPSPIINILSNGRIAFVRLPKKQDILWNSFKTKIAACKTARNSLIGSIAGNKSKIFRRYVDDKGIVNYYKERRIPRNPLSQFAHLIVSSCYEITQEASVSVDSVYTHTDCVVSDRLPQIFQDLQLVVAEKAKGFTEIIQIGNRRVGKDISKFYEAQQEGIIFDKIPHNSQHNGINFSRWLF